MTGERLRPSPEFDESLLQKADAIFEHEQENIVGVALQLPSVEKPKKYIGEFGCATIPRPCPMRSPNTDVACVEQIFHTNGSRFRAQAPGILTYASDYPAHQRHAEQFSAVHS